MILVEILIVVLAVLALLFAAVVAVSFYLAVPFSDVVNAMLRRVGLAGPSPGSRSAGGHVVGTVDEPFLVSAGSNAAVGRVFVKGELWSARCDPAIASDLRPGDEVEVEYTDDLTVYVVGRSRPVRRARP